MKKSTSHFTTGSFLVLVAVLYAWFQMSLDGPLPLVCFLLWGVAAYQFYEGIKHRRRGL